MPEATKETVPAPLVGPNVQQIASDMIQVDKGWNARVHTDKWSPDASADLTSGEQLGTTIDALAEDIARRGLLSPLVVVISPDNPKKFKLIAGFRRAAALTKLGHKVWPCNVVTADKTEARMINIVENVQREDLSHGEIARACLEIKKETGWGGSAIGGRLGLSKPHVNNLIRLAEELNPKIFDMFLHGDKRCPAIGTLLKIVAIKDHDKQWSFLQDPEGAGVDVTEGGGGDGDKDKDKKKGRKRPTPKQILAVYTYVNKLIKDGSTDYAPDYLQGALELLGWVTGKAKRKSCPIELPTEEEEEEEAEEKGNGKKGAKH